MTCNLFGKSEEEQDEFNSVEAEHRLKVCVPSRVALGWKGNIGQNVRWTHRPQAYVPK